MTSPKETGTFSPLLFSLVVSAIFILPGIAGYLVISHKPLARVQLTDVIGHVDRWTVESDQAPGAAGSGPSKKARLVISTSEHRASFSVRDRIYNDPASFSAEAFGKSVKKGDALVFTIRNIDAKLTSEGRIDLFGLASPKAVYLSTDNGLADYALERKRAMTWAVGCLVLAALLAIAARMMWKKRTT